MLEPRVLEKPEGKRARNRQERTEALTSAALRLFLERGIEPVTIDEIARAAGMAKGNFYRYFEDKGALVDAILAPTANAVRTEMRRGAVELGRSTTPANVSTAYFKMALALASGLSGRFDVVQLYLQENRSPATPSTAGVRALAEEMISGAIHLTQVAVDHGLLRVSDSRVSALAVVGSIEQLALAVVRGRLDAPPAEIARIIVGMVLEGIRA